MMLSLIVRMVRRFGVARGATIGVCTNCGAALLDSVLKESEAGLRPPPTCLPRSSAHLLTRPEPGSLTNLLNLCSSLGTQKSSWRSVFGGASLKVFFSLTHGFVYALGAVMVMLTSRVSRSTRW